MNINFQNLALLAIVLGSGKFLHASEDESAEMDALLALLEEETELATQSKMNADYVPGMVSILHARVLEARGLNTVAEALGQVAGFYMSVDNAGAQVAIVRGVGASLGASNLKLMLNGFPVNRAVDASADWLLRLPLEQVERIEVIRGPGSALYGEYAFSGVVNVIPRTDNRVGIKVGSYSDQRASITYRSGGEDRPLFNFNLSSWNRDSSGLATSLDNFAYQGLGFSPGLRYDHEQGLSFLAEIDVNGYTLQMQQANIKRGGWFGRNAALPEELNPRVEKAGGLHLTKSWQLSSSLALQAKVSSRKSRVELAAFLPIVAGVDPPGPRPPVLVNTYRQAYDVNTIHRVTLGTRWQANEQHQLLFDLGYAGSELESVANKSFELGQTPTVIADNPGTQRKLSSITFQDQWKVSEQLEVTLGARHDDYDDWGSHTSPRLAAVWRPGDKHIYKIQLANAFRPPTIRELSPGMNVVNRPLQEETIDSTEFSYIFRDGNLNFRSTLFESKIKNLIEFFIDPGNPPTYRNRGAIDSYGLELEWIQKFNREFSFSAFLSLITAKDNREPDDRLTGSVDWLANFSIDWQATDKTLHSLLLNMVGEQEGWDIASALPIADQFDSYYTLNYSASIDDLLSVSKLKLQISVNNITDEQYRVLPNPAFYPTGLPLGERTIWLGLEYAF